MNRQERAQLAAETVAILEHGGYLSPAGQQIALSARIERCRTGTVCYEPDAFGDSLERDAAICYDTILSVANETTLAGARRLASGGDYRRVGVLNFASAKRPGGGFLNGSAAQEESLARSSALYASLQAHPEFYATHRQAKNSAYADRMIYSPDCPVFRDDEGRLLEAPYDVDMITCAAPNAGAMGRSRRSGLPAILKRRAGKILALAVAKKCDALVLGAWGCGVFRNDPALVASIFRDWLTGGGPFAGQFKYIQFSVLDDTPQQSTFAAFAELELQS